MMCLILAVSGGCGGGDKQEENVLNTVRGAIKFKGKDIPTASIVSFHPKDGSSTGQVISGTYSSEDSYFSVETVKDGETFVGAPVGEYIVTVESPKRNPGAIPAKYAKPATSGLTVEIKQGMNNLKEITLQP